MWQDYPGAGNELSSVQGREECLSQTLIFRPTSKWRVGHLFNCPFYLISVFVGYARLFITWLNKEALEFGGRLVDPLPRCVLFESKWE